MKQTLSILTAFLTVAAATAQTNILRQPVSIPIDGYAAQINDQVITRGEVHAALAPILPELYRAYQGEKLQRELENAFERTRRDLVERALILEAFKARGAMIPDQYVNDEVKRVIQSRFKGDKARFEQVLAEQKQTREEFTEIIREKIAVDMMMGEEVLRRARITPEQVREAYDANQARYHIPEKVKLSIILLNKGATAEEHAVKREEAETIRTRLLDGADFAETAKAVSEGSRAADGGAFQWMQPKDVRPELQATLKTLPVGQISEIIETDNEFYLVKIEARRQENYTPFSEVRDDIKKMLTSQERARLRTRWVNRLKENNYVVIYD